MALRAKNILLVGHLCKTMNVIINGCNGKMGQAVEKAANSSGDCTVIAGVDLYGAKTSKYPIFKNLKEVDSNITNNADVLIDFSNPSALDDILVYVEKEKIPAVICTTGFTDNQVEKIKNVSKSVPIFYSRNMSLGINLILELAKKATKILKNDFDVEIIEKHHNQKIDAPSGTALMIAEEISSAMPQLSNYVFDRSKIKEKRSKNEIGIHSIRGGTIPGDHEVIFAGEKEIVTLSHHAESREIFANGAIKAAKCLVRQKPGFYTMKDMIKS